jgi:hypothetical protein
VIRWIGCAAAQALQTEHSRHQSRPRIVGTQFIDAKFADAKFADAKFVATEFKRLE